MKRIVSLVFLAAMVQAASAQLLTNVSANGWANTSTGSYDWRYVPSGGGRGSHNYHWAPIGDQSFSSSASLPLNGSTGVVSSTGTFFAPHYYAATCWGSNSFVNGTSRATLSLKIAASSYFSPTLGPLDGASVNADVLQELFFTLPNDSNVSATINAPLGALISFKNLTNGDVYLGNAGTFSDVLPGGCAYELFVHVLWGASQDNYQKTSYNVGKSSNWVTAQLVVTPSNGN